MYKDAIVVTGASRGIGRYLAEKLHSLGNRVIGIARHGELAAAFEMRSADVADYDRLSDVLRDIRRDRSVWGLINAAGIASMNLLVTTPPQTVRRIVETNLIGTIYCSQLVAPAMIRRGGGRIVNFSTIAVSLGLEGESVYVASKAGVEGFSRAFAREVAARGITVNVIAPGPVDTDLIAKVPDEKIETIVDRQVVRRKASVDDVLATTLMLLSRETSMLSGQVFHVGGV